MALAEVSVEASAAHVFAEHAAHLPIVAAIVSRQGRNGLSIWIVLDGDRDGSTRDAVYDLQLATRLSFPDAVLGFSIVDIAEYPGTPLGSLVPLDGQTLYIRPGQVL